MVDPGKKHRPWSSKRAGAAGDPQDRRWVLESGRASERGQQEQANEVDNKQVNAAVQMLLLMTNVAVVVVDDAILSERKENCGVGCRRGKL